eukprot:g61588.t1
MSKSVPAPKEPISVAVIGVGCMGREHIQNLALLPQFRLVALVDDHPASLSTAHALLRSLADTPGRFIDPAAVNEFETVSALFRSACHFDAVIIATPNFTHYAILKECIRHQTHILVEKPLCRSVAQCLEIQKLAQDYPKILWVGMEYRYVPPIAELIKEVDKGVVGAIHMIAIREHRFPFLAKVRDWNRLNHQTGGTLVEKACHFFDLMRRIAGGRTPLRVMASGGQDVNHLDQKIDGQPADILDNAYVIVDFEGQVRAVLDLCMFAENSKQQGEISVVGSQGKVEVFTMAHGDKKATTVPNVRIGKRAPWHDRPDCPDPSSYPPLEERIASVNKELLEAGNHSGATYVELLQFSRAITESATKGSKSRAVVDVADGVLAVAMGVAAQV